MSDLDMDHQMGLRSVAQGNCWNVADMILSDLMQIGLVKREGTDRVLTDKGKREYQRMLQRAKTSG